MLILPEEVKLLLTTEPLLAGRVGMLTLGGSLAYGTNLPDKGDIDIRGFAFEPPEQLIGNIKNFETYTDLGTDTVIYSFNKFIQLLLENNPNILETLGCRADHYFYAGSVAQELVTNLDKFIHKRVFHTFGGYAKMQLARMENAISHSSLEGRKVTEHIQGSMERAMYSFEERYSGFEHGNIKINIVPSKKDPEETELALDINLNNFPLEQVVSMLSEFNNINRAYTKLNHRNRKSTPEKLDKHAMHIIRLLMTGIELMTTGKMTTYRAKEQQTLLSVRQGKFRNPDGTYNTAFYDLKADLDKEFEYAKANTVLPDQPDREWINAFVYKTNYQTVNGCVDTLQL